MYRFTEQDGQEIYLPEGYTEFEVWEKDNPQSLATRPPTAEIRRWANDKLSFILDPNNQKYIDFQKKRSKQTNDLKKALEAELRKRGMRMTTLKHKGNKRKIAILLRGPFLSTKHRNKEGKVFNGRVERNYFSLHFDAQDKLHMSRVWLVPKDGDNESLIRQLRFRKFVSRKIEELKPFLDENFGDWEKIATELVDILKFADEQYPQ